jgi:serine/threonine protein kinase
MTQTVTKTDIEGEAAVIEFIKSGNGHENIIGLLSHGWLKGAFRVYYIDMELAQTTLTAYIAAFRTQTTPFAFLNPNLIPVFLDSNCTTEERIHNLWVIGKHIIDGLVFLHSGGHVHRDLKPNNGNMSTFHD